MSSILRNLEKASRLPSERVQLFLDLCSGHLCIAQRGLESRSPSQRHMPQIVGNLFQRPSSRKCAMSKVISQIMKADIGNHGVFFWSRLLFEGTKPVMKTSVCESGASLRRKDIRARLVTRSLLEIGIQGTACFIYQVNIPTRSSCLIRFCKITRC